MVATEEPCPVGLEFRRAHSFAVDDRQMSSPDFRVARRSLPPPSQDRPDIGEILRFDEQLRECRMRNIRALRRQDKFGI